MDEKTEKALQELEREKKAEEQVAQPQQAAQRQPAPTTMEYSQKYRLTDVFIDHLKMALKDVPCWKAMQYISYAENNKDGIDIVDLNGFIKKLDMIEYGYIGGMMANIKNAELQKNYFVELPINK